MSAYQLLAHTIEVAGMTQDETSTIVGVSTREEKEKRKFLENHTANREAGKGKTA